MASEPVPSWTLKDWLTALKISIPEFAARTTIEGMDVQRFLYECGRGRQTIQTRAIALAFITEFNKIATERELSVMSCENLHRHAEIFFSSAFCRADFGILRPVEFQAICPDYLSKKKMTPSDGIIDRVHPRPPDKLFGRSHDLHQAVGLIQNYPICVISAIGGHGKTALAWYMTQAMQGGQKPMFCEFDWVTDKRMSFVVNAVPGWEKLDNEVSLQSLLRSMVTRFGWDDLHGLDETELLNRCAERLQQEAYLLVVDNLETVENQQTLVRQLLRLLGVGSGKDTPSRALITSRHSLDIPGCGNYRLQGIEESQRIPYIHYLQPMINFPPLALPQMESLAESTGGNPLFIQVALQRYALAPHKFAEVRRDLAQGNLLPSVFDYVFEPLIMDLQTMHPQAGWLAKCAAALPVIYQSELMEYWQAAFPADVQYEGYYEALAILRSRMIIEIVSNMSDELTMHPLIRAYFTSHD